MQAILDPTRSSILQSTCLLVCFATPHRGGNHARLGDVVAKIVRAFSRAPQNDLINALQLKSSEAMKRFDQSKHLVDRFYFVNFYEEEPYGRMGIVSSSGDNFVENGQVCLTDKADCQQRIGNSGATELPRTYSQGRCRS